MADSVECKWCLEPHNKKCTTLETIKIMGHFPGECISNLKPVILSELYKAVIKIMGHFPGECISTQFKTCHSERTVQRSYAQ
jgi:hypothetical protein